MIRKIRKEDREAYIEMTKALYSSEAVCHEVSETHFYDTFEELMRQDIYAAGYIIEEKGNIAGYGLTAKGFSQEAGGILLWIEEIYIKPEYRGLGLGREFFAYVEANLCKNVKRLRLEVDKENKNAISLYKKMGFENLDYLQMVKDL